MKSSRQELKIDGAVEVPHVIAYLEQLVTALKSGAVRVHRGAEQVVLGPRGVVGFSLAASDKGKRQKLSLELSWRKFAAPDADLDLVIGPAAELPPAPEVPADASELPPTLDGAAESAAKATAESDSESPVPTPGEVVLGEAD
ncbi:amphi-Trp domain-containing protein [Nannocystis exedens]|uniref:Amphi-Trp domain-containing protein n=1 Tax=Nannocystis exedens TaxID=54 RepID=A0A1I2GEZ0_9BACT|nr:amphi-Trp domain-containing protein [Nannocystis exedens]PCC69977.1 amphi-Trp domain-containing protein [Nannocystis exedens]SFF16072.1 amphi-Trp domain-containing protein [Nannocystis exedens]